MEILGIILLVIGILGIPLMFISDLGGMILGAITRSNKSFETDPRVRFLIIFGCIALVFTGFGMIIAY